MPDNTDEARRAIVSAYNRMYAAKNRERIAAKARERYQQNREKLLAQGKARVEAWVKENPEARKEHQKRYRENNREKLREAHRKYVSDKSDGYKESSKRKYGEWRQSLDEMAGRPRPETCEACGGPPDPKKGLHFNHCHTNGHFRGWICRSCNLALGNVQDDPIRLLKLVAYLKRTKEGYANQFALPGL